MREKTISRPAENEEINPLRVEKESKLIVNFAVPCIISMLVTSLYNIVDQIFIGQGVGMLGNAATNIAFPLSIACTAISLLLGIGAASNFSLPIAKAKPVQVLDEDGGLSTLIIGTEKPAKATKLRSLGLMGLFVTENDKDVPHPVFYRVPDAKEALRILESAAN